MCRASHYIKSHDKYQRQSGELLYYTLMTQCPDPPQIAAHSHTSMELSTTFAWQVHTARDHIFARFFPPLLFPMTTQFHFIQSATWKLIITSRLCAAARPVEYL